MTKLFNLSFLFLMSLSLSLSAQETTESTETEDTETHELIRRHIESPEFRERLRIQRDRILKQVDRPRGEMYRRISKNPLQTQHAEEAQIMEPRLILSQLGKEAFIEYAQSKGASLELATEAAEACESCELLGKRELAALISSLKISTGFNTKIESEEQAAKRDAAIAALETQLDDDPENDQFLTLEQVKLTATAFKQAGPIVLMRNRISAQYRQEDVAEQVEAFLEKAGTYGTLELSFVNEDGEESNLAIEITEEGVTKVNEDGEAVDLREPEF